MTADGLSAVQRSRFSSFSCNQWEILALKAAAIFKETKRTCSDTDPDVAVGGLTIKRPDALAGRFVFAGF